MGKKSRNDTDGAVKVLNRIIADYRNNPVDLLKIGDGGGEFRYLSAARPSYERTIRDVCGFFQQAHPPGKPVRVLEIGAYLGVVSLSLAELGFAMTAMDIPEYMANENLQARYSRQGVNTAVCNLAAGVLPFPDAVFDMVIMCETLEHLNFNPLPVLAEIRRVLRPGGGFYLSLPNLASLVNRVKLLTGRSIHNPISDFHRQLCPGSNMIVGLHWREYTRAEILELLELAGFSTSRHYFFTSTPSMLPARLLYHFFPQLRPNQTVFACRPAAS